MRSRHGNILTDDRRLDAEQDQLPCGSTGSSSGICQDRKTCMVRTCHTPRQPLHNHPSGHQGGWATSWSQRKCWMDNIKEKTSLPMPELLTRVSCRKDWNSISAESSLVSSRPPIWSFGVWTEWHFEVLKFQPAKKANDSENSHGINSLDQSALKQ